MTARWTILTGKVEDVLPNGPIPWTGDAMAFAKAHVAAGVLRIDEDGRIWRVARLVFGTWQPVEPRRAENIGGKGYLRISIGIPGHRLAIVMAHRLVYEMRVGSIPEGLQINHKDLDKQNNRPSNLEVVTGHENIRHSYANGRTPPWSRASVWRGRPMVTEDQKRLARDMRASGEPLKRIAAALGIGITHAQRLTSGAKPCTKE